MSADRTLPERGEDDERQARRDALRKEALARRRRLSPDDCARRAAAIRTHLKTQFAFLAAQRVAFYWPIHNEPDLRPLMASWLADAEPGFAALLPVVERRHEALVFRLWQPLGELVADACGILAPATGLSETPQALLIPVNAFDAAGYRLGYGGGYFDRTLAALSQLTAPPLTIGVGFETARVASIEPQAHDLRLDAVVTEAGVFRFGSAL